MGSFSAAHWIIVLVVVLIVFGAGRLPQTMGDLAKGVRSFRKGMREEPATEDDPALVDAKPSDRAMG